MPSRRSTSPSAVAERCGLAGEHAIGALDERDFAAEAAHDLRQLDAGRSRRPRRAAGGGPPSFRSPRGCVQTPSSSRRPGTGGMNGSAPLASTTCSAVWRTPSTRRRRCRRAARSAQESRCPGPASQRTCPASEYLDTMKSRQASAAWTSTSAWPPLRRAPDGLTRSQQRLGRNARPVGALASDEFALDNRDAQAPFGQRAGAVLAGRAAAEHDDVVVAAGAVVGASRHSIDVAVGTAGRIEVRAAPGR